MPIVAPSRTVWIILGLIGYIVLVVWALLMLLLFIAGLVIGFTVGNIVGIDTVCGQVTTPSEVPSCAYR